MPTLTQDDLKRLREQKKRSQEKIADTPARAKGNTVNPFLSKLIGYQGIRGATANLSDPLLAGVLSLSPKLSYSDARKSVSNLNKYAQETAPKATMAANIGGSMVGFGKLARAGKLPSQLISRTRGNTQNLSKLAMKPGNVATDAATYSVVSDVAEDNDKTAYDIVGSALASGAAGGISAGLLNSAGNLIGKNVNKKLLKKEGITTESIIKNKDSLYAQANKLDATLPNDKVRDGIITLYRDRGLTGSIDELGPDRVLNYANKILQKANSNKPVSLNNLQSLQREINEDYTSLKPKQKRDFDSIKRMLDDTVKTYGDDAAKQSNNLFQRAQKESARLIPIKETEEFLGTTASKKPTKIQPISGLEKAQKQQGTYKAIEDFATTNYDRFTNAISDPNAANTLRGAAMPTFGQRIGNALGDVAISSGKLGAAGAMGITATGAGFAGGGGAAVPAAIAYVTTTELAKLARTKTGRDMLQKYLRELKLGELTKRLTPKQEAYKNALTRTLSGNFEGIEQNYD